MDFLTLAKQRCTVRLFEDRPLEKEKLDYILEAGRLAPTACNKQPQRILVLQKRENIEKVQKAYSTFGARCVMIIGRDTRESLIRPYDGKCSGDLDIGIVTSQMMLAAREKEIGSVMVGLFDPRIIREEFHIPDYVEPTALLILGYPKNGFPDTKSRETLRKPLNETVMLEEFSLL